MSSKMNVSFYNSSFGKSVCLDYVLNPGPVGTGYAGKNIEEAVFEASRVLKENPVNKITLDNKVQKSVEVKRWAFTRKELRKFRKLLKEKVQNIEILIE